MSHRLPPPLVREWQAFTLALGFLSRIPMIWQVDYSQRLMNQSSVYFPLVGLLLGASYAGLYLVLAWLWPASVSVLLVLCFHLWLTGAFHEDGLADSVDALGGGTTVEHRLSIMKDSRIGTYGSAALFSALALKAVLLLSLDIVWLALLVAPCIARLSPLLLMHFQRYVTVVDTSRTKPVADGFSGHRLLAAALFVVAVSAVFQVLIPAVSAILVISLIWSHLLKQKLGGYTGDTLGASVILTELLFLLILTAIA